MEMFILGTPPCFNSRTPGGVRLVRALHHRQDTPFQFTHPGRGATIIFSMAKIARIVSIHAPREGCDR